MALQQHFLEGSRKGKVAFKGKRAVGELGLARLALVAVGMKTVGQTEAFRKRAEGIPGILSLHGTCAHVGKPGIGVAAPPVGTVVLQFLEGRINDFPGLFSL